MTGTEGGKVLEKRDGECVRTSGLLFCFSVTFVFEGYSL